MRNSPFEIFMACALVLPSVDCASRARARSEGSSSKLYGPPKLSPTPEQQRQEWLKDRITELVQKSGYAEVEWGGMLRVARELQEGKRNLESLRSTVVCVTESGGGAFEWGDADLIGISRVLSGDEILLDNEPAREKARTILTSPGSQAFETPPPRVFLLRNYARNGGKVTPIQGAVFASLKLGYVVFAGVASYETVLGGTMQALVIEKPAWNKEARKAFEEQLAAYQKAGAKK